MDAVFGFLNNPIVLMLVGLAIQFVPGLRSFIKNDLIQYLTTALAWLSTLIAPQAAHAAAGPIGHFLPVVAISFGLGGLGSILGGLGAAMLQSAQAYLMRRMFAWPGKHLPDLPKDSV